MYKCNGVDGRSVTYSEVRVYRVMEKRRKILGLKIKERKGFVIRDLVDYC